MLKKLKAASVKAAASKLDTSPGGLKKNAVLQYNTGLYRDAIETFNKVLSHPSICSNGEASSKSVSVGSANGAVDGNLFRMLGHSHYLVYKETDVQKDIDFALEYYKKAIDEYNFLDPTVLSEAAEVYRRQNCHEGALHLYAVIIDAFPTFILKNKLIVMNAISCMFHLKALDHAHEYLFWLAEDPPPEIPEDILYLLAARAYELLKRDDLAMMGFDQLFQKKKANGQTGEHNNWAQFRDDSELWRQMSELFMELEMYEMVNHCNAEAFRLSKLHTGSFIAYWALVNARMGDYGQAERHLRGILKGKFLMDAVDSKRKIPPNHKKYGKKLEGENLELLTIVEKSTFMANYILKRAKAADLNARERWELVQMRRAEEATKWFLTEEKIWFAGRTICAYSRGHIARNYKRKAYKAIRDIQRVFRGHLGRERAANVRAYRRINAASILIKSWNMLRVRNARWKLMSTAANFVIGERWLKRNSYWRINKLTWIHMFQTRIRNIVETEKLHRAARRIQNLFRKRMMKELMRMIYYREPSALIFRLFYRNALSGPCLEILMRLLSPYAVAIQCRFRQKVAIRRVAKRREEYRIWCKKQEERREREARRKAVIEYRERQRRA